MPLPARLLDELTAAVVLTVVAALGALTRWLLTLDIATARGRRKRRILRRLARRRNRRRDTS